MRSYVIIVIGGTLTLLALIAAANFLFDPGNVYLKKTFNRKVVDRYTDAMLESTYGVIQEGWNERDVKLSLARKRYRDSCLVLGSSHVMGLSILRGQGLDLECDKLVNLGVSGATLEDIAIFSETLIESGLGDRGNRVYIGVSPWLFHFNKDARYVPYSESYRAFLERVDMGQIAQQSGSGDYRLHWISNLISADYFRQVIELLRRDGVGPHLRQVVRILGALNAPGEYVDGYRMSEFDILGGSGKAITLSDGSHVYTSKLIKGEPDLEIGSYKLEPGEAADPAAVGLFERILTELKVNRFEVVLFFTPYHHNLWEMPAGETARSIMADTNTMASTLAKRLRIPLAGSYDPRVVGCDRGEFYDYMHPSPDCLSRIFLSADRNVL